MARRRRITLWIARLTLLGAIVFACASVKRPPLIVHVGTGWSPTAKNDDDMAGLARVTMPTRPVGLWIDTRYDFGEGRVGAVTGGVIFYFEAEQDPRELTEELEAEPPPLEGVKP